MSEGTSLGSQTRLQSPHSEPQCSTTTVKGGVIATYHTAQSPTLKKKLGEYFFNLCIKK